MKYEVNVSKLLDIFIIENNERMKKRTKVHLNQVNECANVMQFVFNILYLSTVSGINGDKRVTWNRIDEKVNSEIEKEWKDTGNKCNQ